MLAMRVVVIGASLAGLLAAAASAQSGARTMIIERDLLPAAPEARKGVPQGRQAHVLLHRGLRSAEALLPGLRDDLLAVGASAFDSGEMPWLGEYGWMPTWLPSYELVSVTRPLLEHVVRQRVQAFPLVEVRDGVRATGLRRNGAGWQVITEDGAATEADLVIDASGRELADAALAGRPRRTRAGRRSESTPSSAMPAGSIGRPVRRRWRPAWSSRRPRRPAGGRSRCRSRTTTGW